jgi:cell division septation protein DedD
MGEKRKEGGEKGLSAGVLAAVFLVFVGICAVFFSLGFLVGYNEQSSKVETVSERVTRTTPPVVNPPTQTSRARAKETMAPTRATSPGPVADVDVSPSPAAGPKASERGSSEDATAPAESRTEPSASFPAGNEVRMGFTVQVDALRARQDAEALVRILKTRHYPVFLVTPEYSNSRDNLYRVQVGPFISREDAENVRSRLVQEGFKPFIKR